MRLRSIHGMVSPIEKAIEKSKPDIVIYCGDGVENVENISYIYSDIKFYFVKGNCDSGDYPIEQEIKVASKRIFFTHGHLYDTKIDDRMIVKEAKNRGVDVLLYGHTHIPYTEYLDGLYVMNPGSCARPKMGRPTYGFVDIVDGKIIMNIVEL